MDQQTFLEACDLTEWDLREANISWEELSLIAEEYGIRVFFLFPQDETASGPYEITADRRSIHSVGRCGDCCFFWVKAYE